MVERVRVTDPDGEPRNACVRDLSGLYGCLKMVPSEAKH